MSETLRERARMLLHQGPLFAALVVLWMLLWGSVSWLGFASGILVAAAVTAVFYLPPVELSGRFNLFWLAVFLGRFLGQLIVASVQVAWRAFAPSGVRGTAIVAVQLRTRSDLVMTLTAIAVSLVPGSLVVEVDRLGAILYLHALDTRGQADVDAVRRSVLDTERRLVRVLGSNDDRERVAA